MAATSGKQLAVGMKSAYAFALDANGYPAATASATAYEGVELSGAKTFEMTIPDSRKIVHTGNDRVLATDFLAPVESASAVLTIARNDLIVAALFSNVKTFAVAEATMMPWQTDQQGSEIDIALLVYQQSLDAVAKTRHYRFLMMPKCRVVPKLTGMNENAAVFGYEIAPNPSTKHIWGEAMAVGTEGATEAGTLEGMALGRPKIVAWKGDASETEFLLPTNYPATATAKIKCWVDGVVTVPNPITVTTLTISPAPTTGAMIVAYYEY